MKKDLADHEYETYLADNKKEKELRVRHKERQEANKGFRGWHFGLGEQPVHCVDKESFKKELDKRGLIMQDDVRVPIKKHLR